MTSSTRAFASALVEVLPESTRAWVDERVGERLNQAMVESER